MCGFIGIYTNDDSINGEIEIENNFGFISHRGIDKKFLNFGKYSVGYTRLPTDNIEYSGKEYLNNLLYNGIIYNTDYLINKFDLKINDDFDSVILEYGYRSYGIKFLEKLRGMFSFSFYDGKVIDLVRDTIGIKPLYYTFGNGVFAFSSEMKGLVNICKKFNLKIIEVLPGEIIKFDTIKFNFKIEKFSYNCYTGFKGIDLIKESLSNCLINPTIKYLKSGKKIAILLSGGLDSSILLYTLFNNENINKNNVLIFSMGVEGSSDNIATKIIQKDLGIEINYIKPFSEEKSLQMIKDIVFISESSLPRVVKVSIFQYSIASKIRKNNIDVVISGEGADEIFFGYERFYKGISDINLINNLFGNFFENIFFYTLLQRLDRSFSYFTIEGRVPFLDQELVYGTKQLNIDYKIKNGTNKYILRKYAESIGIPRSIVYREKEKMTKGVTNKENNYKDSLNGYLENICYKNYGVYLSEKCLEFYKKDFYINGINLHSNFDSFLQEEDLNILKSN